MSIFALGNPSSLRWRHAGLLDLLEQRVDALAGRGVVEAQRRRRHVVVFHVRDDLAEGAQAGCELRQDDRIDAHLAGQRRDVRRRRAARPDQHEIARIVAALDRHAADAVDHVGVDDREHAVGRPLEGDAERLGDAGPDRLDGAFAVERQPAADQPVRIEVAEHQIGVGVRSAPRRRGRSRPDPARRRRSAARPAAAPCCRSSRSTRRLHPVSRPGSSARRCDSAGNRCSC